MATVIDRIGWVMSEHGVPDSRLTVIAQANTNKRGAACWLCRCSCDEQNEIIVNGGDLRNGHTKSCGCLKKELNTQQILKVYPKGVESAAVKNKKYNKYVLNLEDEHGQYGLGYCSNTNSEFYFDMDDYDKIKNICWSEIDYDGFKQLKGKDIISKKTVTMHQFLGYKYHDHIDRNELNNRKCNLRPATQAENVINRSISKRNSSGIIGVRWINQRHKWKASIGVNKKEIHLGLFVDKDDAIVARLKAEQEYFKEFAPQIHLFEKYGITSLNKEENYEL